MSIIRQLQMSLRDNTDATISQNLGAQWFEVPEMSITMAQLQTLWSSMLPTSTTEIYDFFRTVVSYCGGFIRQPYAFPGFYTKTGNLSMMEDYGVYASLFPPAVISTQYTEEHNNWRVTFAADESNYFSFTPYSSGSSFHLTVNGETSDFGLAGAPGLSTGANNQITESSHVFVKILAITADQRVAWISCHTNKNNSNLSFLTAANSTKFINWLKAVPGPVGDDPFTPGGIAGPGGGGGDYRIVDDPIDFPDLPTISVADAGFVSIWIPSLLQLQDLSNFMWNADPTKITFWKNMISNPIDLILGLSLVPFDVPVELSPAHVTLGIIDSGINMFYTDQQFHEIDCGELDLSEYWGAFLDYAPYTSVEIFLPFIGMRTLNINDCMPKTIHVKYVVDIVTGTCVALIKCGQSVFYHFTGSVAAQIPVTAGQAQQLASQAIGVVASIATGAITGGGAGALAAAVGSASAAAQAGMPTPDRSGNMAGTAGFMDSRTPYLVVTRPRQAVPDGQNALTGYPAFIAAELGDLVGFTQVQVVHLHDMSCTDAEVQEIEQLLSRGVIF